MALSNQYLSLAPGRPDTESIIENGGRWQSFLAGNCRNGGGRERFFSAGPEGRLKKGLLVKTEAGMAFRASEAENLGSRLRIGPVDRALDQSPGPFRG